MSGRSLNLFSVGEDLAVVLEEVETEGKLVYARTGLFADSAGRLFCSQRELPGVGTSTGAGASEEDSFLVVDAGVIVQSRAVPQSSGGVLHAFDQMLNPTSVVLKPGGLHDEACLVAGELSTISEREESIKLYDRLARRIRREYRRVRSFWVGPGAFRVLLDPIRKGPAAMTPRRGFAWRDCDPIGPKTRPDGPCRGLFG
jgi:hypothetical protein